MFKALDAHEPWGKRALNIAVVSLVVSVFLALAEGVSRAELFTVPDHRAVFEMVENWCYNLRNVSDVVLSSAILVFVAAKFFEGRTILTIGFDKTDADRVSIKGPDENNIVWVGHRYASKFEADAIAATLENRIRESKA